jgi:hypothetical protein
MQPLRWHPVALKCNNPKRADASAAYNLEALRQAALRTFRDITEKELVLYALQGEARIVSYSQLDAYLRTEKLPVIWVARRGEIRDWSPPYYRGSQRSQDCSDPCSTKISRSPPTSPMRSTFTRAASELASTTHSALFDSRLVLRRAKPPPGIDSHD